MRLEVIKDLVYYKAIEENILQAFIVNRLSDKGADDVILNLNAVKTDIWCKLEDNLFKRYLIKLRKFIKNFDKNFPIDTLTPDTVWELTNDEVNYFSNTVLESLEDTIENVDLGAAAADTVESILYKKLLNIIQIYGGFSNATIDNVLDFKDIIGYSNHTSSPQHQVFSCIQANFIKYLLQQITLLPLYKKIEYMPYLYNGFIFNNDMTEEKIIVDDFDKYNEFILGKHVKQNDILKARYIENIYISYVTNCNNIRIPIEENGLCDDKYTNLFIDKYFKHIKSNEIELYYMIHSKMYNARVTKTHDNKIYVKNLIAY